MRHAFLDRRVGLVRGVDGEAPGRDAVVLGAAAAGPVQGGQQRDERGVGGGVLDDAAARAVGTEPLGEIEQPRQPVEDVGLELRSRGGGGPQHALHAEPGREQIAEDGRAAGGWPGSRRRTTGAASA